MLTRKAAGVLAAVVGLASASILVNAYGAAVLAVALLILFSLNAFAVLPPRLEVEVDEGPGEVSEDQRTEIRVDVENPTSRSMFFEQRLGVPDTFDVEGAHGQFATFAGEEERSWTVAFRPRLLGGYHVGPLEVRVRDPSSFRVRDHELGPERRMLVKPRHGDLKTSPIELGETVRFFGLHEATQPGEGFEFYTLRGWEDGDTISMVNWRATARTDDLMVNQRARESFVKVAVLLDATEHTFQGRLISSPFAECARAVATLTGHLLDNRDEVSFHVLTDEVETIHPQAAERQRRTIMETMATTQPGGRVRWEDVIDDLLPTLNPAQPIVIASPFETDPSVIPALRSLAARDHQILALSAPTDWPDDAPEEMVEIRRQHRDVIKQEIRRAGGDFVEVGMDRPLGEAFLEAVMA